MRFKITCGSKTTRLEAESPLSLLGAALDLVQGTRWNGTWQLCLEIGAKPSDQPKAPYAPQDRLYLTVPIKDDTQLERIDMSCQRAWDHAHDASARPLLQ